MNKIFLKKSFAGYPVGVYELIGLQYVIVDENGTIINGIHKDIVEGMKNHFEEIKERPTSWGSLGEIDGYWVDDCGGVNVAIYCNSSSDEEQSIFKTEQQAEASIALAQITQLLDKYDIPEESRKWYTIDNCVYDSYDYTRKKGLLRFDTKEKKDHFYKHHADLISKLAPFYIF